MSETSENAKAWCRQHRRNLGVLGTSTRQRCGAEAKEQHGGLVVDRWIYRVIINAFASFKKLTLKINLAAKLTQFCFTYFSEHNAQM